MFSIEQADSYMQQHIIDVSDWESSDDAKKTRMLNVANRTLVDTFPTLTICAEAVYEYAAVLAVAYNDTNKLNAQGIASFSITGVGSFTFKDAKTIEELIPNTAIKLLEKANNTTLSKKGSGSITIRYTV